MGCSLISRLSQCQKRDAADGIGPSGQHMIGSLKFEILMWELAVIPGKVEAPSRRWGIALSEAPVRTL